MRSHTHALSLFLALGISWLSAESAPPTAEPIFVLHAVEGADKTGPLDQIANDWSVTLGGSKGGKVSGAEVVSLRRSGKLLPPWPTEQHLQFVNGDRLAGQAIDLRGERLRFRAPQVSSADLAIPLTGINVYWLALPDSASSREAVLKPWQSGRRTRDIVLLRNGDVTEGTLASMDAETLSLRGSDKREIKLERRKIAAILFSNDLVRSLRPRGVYARLVLANGDRISLASAEANAKTLSGKTLFGSAIQVPVEQIVALDLYQNRAVYLSDLKPKRYEYTPYLDVAWPYFNDLSVAGNPLKLGGNWYDKGLGLHSQCTITFDLGGAYRWFEATVGLDETTGRGGSAGIAVLVDGKPQDVGGAADLSIKDPPRELRVPVNGGRELTLVVTFGRHGDVQDHTDWGNARLLR